MGIQPPSKGGGPGPYPLKGYKYIDSILGKGNSTSILGCDNRKRGVTHKSDTPLLADNPPMALSERGGYLGGGILMLRCDRRRSIFNYVLLGAYTSILLVKNDLINERYYSTLLKLSISCFFSFC